MATDKSARRATASDRIFVRWKALTLTDPVAKLIRAGAHAQLDDYDLRQLTVRCIDLVVANQDDLDGELSTSRLVDLLTDAARRLLPDDPERRWTKVAQHVVNSLLNSGDGEQFEATYTRPSEDGDEWAATQDFRFRLLELKDGLEGTRVVATDETIMLYLQALEVDLTDQQAALTLMMQRQMEAGRFDKARLSARQAMDTARAYTTLITEAIDDTRRDVTVVDWAGDMPERLRDALDHVTEQVDMEDRLLGLARQGADADDRDVASDCADIEVSVRTCQSAHIRLERRINEAIPAFLAAQEAQRLRPRSLQLAWRPVDDLLAPALSGAIRSALALCDTFADRSLGFRRPVVATIDGIVETLLRAPTTREVVEGVVDHPGELVDVEESNISPKVSTAAAQIFHHALSAPRRLSWLLDQVTVSAPFPDADPDPDVVADVVWGGALWLFVSPHGSADDGKRLHGDLAEILGHLGAISDGTSLDHPRYQGDDLLVAAAEGASADG